MLGLRLQIFMIVLSLCFMAYVAYQVRKESIDLKYSFLWLLIGGMLIFISLVPESVRILADFLGIDIPVNALFLVSIFFIFIIIMLLTIEISKSSRKIARLTQELGLLRQKLDELRKKPGK